MTRIIVKLSQLVGVGGSVTGPGDVTLTLEAGPSIGDVDPDIAATTALPDLDNLPDTVARGRALMSLLQASPPVKAALSAALANVAGSEPIPLYFQSSGIVDSMPWEQLFYDRSGFCALDGRWPIGRMVRRGSDLGARLFTPPLRIVAVVAAALPSSGAAPDYPGVEQLDRLADAIGAAPFGVHLHVISGHEDVLTRAQQLTAAGATVSAEPIGGDVNAVKAQITAANPHVLHIFSHGSQDWAGLRVLNLATTADADAEAEFGSINMTAQALTEALTPCNPWLVVLAACDAGQQSVDGQAFARELVGGGLPAVIAMRNRVDVLVMNRITAALYPAICTRVSAAVATSSSPAPAVLDWSAVLTGARTVNAGPDPRANTTWSDLVLYVHPSQLQVIVVAHTGVPADELSRRRGERDEWQRFLDQLTPDAPERLVTAARRRIAELDRLVVTR